MTKKNNIHRFERLETLKARMKSGDPTTIADLANELLVSERTIARDIQLLRDQGLPIDSERGRGGGVRLDRNWGIGRIKLNYSEAVDLLVSLAIAEQMESPLFMANLKNIRHKIMASFSPPKRFTIKDMKKRILVGGSASINMLSSFTRPDKEIVERLHQAFSMKNRLSIKYRAENLAITKRVIEPHYLLLCSPIWYVVAWDELRQDVRSFRCDRILYANIDAHEFALLPIKKFEKAFVGLVVI